MSSLFGDENPFEGEGIRLVLVSVDDIGVVDLTHNEPRYRGEWERRRPDVIGPDLDLRDIDGALSMRRIAVWCRQHDRAEGTPVPDADRVNVALGARPDGQE